MAAKKEAVKKVTTDSVTILNGIREQASDTYKASVPVAYANNLPAVGKAIAQIPQNMNEFLSALVNRIGLVITKGLFYTNPLKIFKKGTLEWGESIEEIFVGLAKSYTYSWDGSYTDPTGDATEENPFKRETPDVSVFYHTVNFRKVYKTTTSEPEINLAFTNAEGIYGLVERIVGSLYAAYEVDEWNTTKGLFKTAYDNKKFTTITVPATTTEAGLKSLVKTMRATSSKLTMPSKNYNSAGVVQVTPREDQYVIITSDLEAALDVDILASAFNMDKTTFLGHLIVIDAFPDNMGNVQALVVDKDWFVIYDKLFRTESIYNPSQLYFNYFLHVWVLFSTSEFENAICYEVAATPPTPSESDSEVVEA